MNAQSILDKLLNSGKELASELKTKAKESADNNENIPEEGPERDALLKGLGAGAAVAGAMALLLGTGAGRKLTGTALKVGSVAAIGGLGYTVFKKWQQEQGVQVGENALHQLSGEAAEKRSEALVTALVAAANADGHISDSERAVINSKLESLGLDDKTMSAIQSRMGEELNAEMVAKGSDCMEASIEIWLASKAVIDDENQIEKRYLARLQRALKLPDELVEKLDAEARA